jgi:hypothetical protein
MLRSQRTVDIELTPDLALHWLNDLRWESNRRISDLHVRRMSRVHLRDEFPETEAIHCSVNGEDNRNLDSQHRCQMVVETKKPLFLKLKLYDAPGEKPRRQLWKTIDRGRARLLSQAIEADEWDEAGYHCKSEMLMVERVAELIEGKLSLAAVKSNLFSFVEKTEFAFEWSARARLLFDAMAGAPNMYRDLMQRKLVMSVLLPLCSSEEFRPKMADLVGAVAHNRNLQPKSAAHRMFLELQKSGSDLKGRAAVEFMRKVAYCCVRHIEDLPCQAMPAETPVALPGTDIVIG